MISCYNFTKKFHTSPLKLHANIEKVFIFEFPNTPVNVHTDFAGQRPTLTGSVLQCPFEFWCLRIHWGAKDEEGSEYRVMGNRSVHLYLNLNRPKDFYFVLQNINLNRFPMEIHLVFRRVNDSLTNGAQLDGNEDTLILVYTCKVYGNT